MAVRRILKGSDPIEDMHSTAIDHLNLKIPVDERETAIEFYENTLGFEIERLEQFETGETPFFAVRLTPNSVLHLWPDEDFEAPTRNNYDHVSIHLEESHDQIRNKLESQDVPIVDDREVLGANGEARAIYIRDPFGYLVELKESH